MASFSRHDTRRSLRALRWPLRWTRLGMVAESAVQSLWPMMTVVLLVLAAIMLGLHESAAVEIVWAVTVVSVVAVLGTLIYALGRFRLPSQGAAMVRLDASLPGRPIQALMDDQTIGASDDASAAVWRAHQARMAAQAAQAKAIPADLRVASRDPYALRYAAVLAFAVALLFGSIWRVGAVTELNTAQNGLANGPVWEGWAEPPRYTGKPTLYLNDQVNSTLELPQGSLITLRLYGEVGALTLAETVSGRVENIPPASDKVQDFTVIHDGSISIAGPNGRTWDITVIADKPPTLEVLDAPTVTALGEMRLPFKGTDDYGIAAGEAVITLDLASVDRRHGLEVAPENRPQIVMPLPTPIAGNRSFFEENLIENFSRHPWANLPVTITLTALDAAEQTASTPLRAMTLPGRRFFDPMAAAVIEQRRDLLWSRANAARIAQVLRAVSNRPQEIFRSQTSALRLRKLLRRLETLTRLEITDENQTEMAQALWDLALELEEGSLADALERMRRAQDRLAEAMKNGASKEEIAELMQELRQATDEYLQQLQRQQAQRDDGSEGSPEQQGERMMMTQDDLQAMRDRIQELMEQGRMAEAEQALREYQELMENMEMAEGQPGQNGPQSPGEQAMEGLSETLRDQQGLSDQAFRDLQEQFNPGAQAGESQGNEGRNGGQGQGQSHEGQQGQGEGEGEQQGQAQNGQQGDQGQAGSDQQGNLAQRQQALRDELNRQQGQLPGAGTPEGEAARDALDRAGEAMDGAEQALRNNDLAEAIDNQAQAMEALRDGIRSLGEALQEQQQANQQPGQGPQDSGQPQNAQDPLGRDGKDGTDGGASREGRLAKNGQGYGRAAELLDEIRRRSAQQGRTETERNYLQRLMDRF